MSPLSSGYFCCHLLHWSYTSSLSLPFSFNVGNITVALSLSKTPLFKVTSVEPFTFEIVPEIHPEIHLNANCKQCEKRVEWWFAMLTFGLCCLLSYFPVPGC